MGSNHLMDANFSFAKRKEFWRWMVMMVANSMNVFS